LRGIKYILWAKDKDVRGEVEKFIGNRLENRAKILPYSKRGKAPAAALEQVRESSFERRVIRDRHRAGHFAQRTVRSLGVVDIFDIGPDGTVFLIQAKAGNKISKKEVNHLLKVAGDKRVVDLDKARKVLPVKFYRRLRKVARYAFVPVLVSRSGSHGRLKWTMLRSGVSQHRRLPARENW
jgi:hypothetical protein